MYGYQLRAAFEETTGGTWPLNIGQVYSTLSRLERDALVRELSSAEAGQRSYEITEAGRRELALWFATPVSRSDRPRDELRSHEDPRAVVSAAHVPAAVGVDPVLVTVEEHVRRRRGGILHGRDAWDDDQWRRGRQANADIDVHLSRGRRRGDEREKRQKCVAH